MSEGNHTKKRPGWAVWIALSAVCCFLCFGTGYRMGRVSHSDYSIYPAEIASVSRENPYEGVEEDNLPRSSVYPININTADAERLELLPNIGETRAADIIAYREEHGAFQTKDELLNVPGIGEGTLAEIEGLIEIEERE